MLFSNFIWLVRAALTSLELPNGCSKCLQSFAPWGLKRNMQCWKKKVFLEITETLERTSGCRCVVLLYHLDEGWPVSLTPSLLPTWATWRLLRCCFLCSMQSILFFLFSCQKVNYSLRWTTVAKLLSWCCTSKMYYIGINHISHKWWAFSGCSKLKWQNWFKFMNSSLSLAESKDWYVHCLFQPFLALLSQWSNRNLF